MRRCASRRAASPRPRCAARSCSPTARRSSRRRRRSSALAPGLPGILCAARQDRQRRRAARAAAGPARGGAHRGAARARPPTARAPTARRSRTRCGCSARCRARVGQARRGRAARARSARARQAARRAGEDLPRSRPARPRGEGGEAMRRRLPSYLCGRWSWHGRRAIAARSLKCRAFAGRGTRPRCPLRQVVNKPSRSFGSASTCLGVPGARPLRCPD